MKRNIFIGLLILLVALGIASYQMRYLSGEDDNQVQDVSFSSLESNFPPQMDVVSFLQDNPSAIEPLAMMDGRTEIDVARPSLSLHKKFSDSYFESCGYIFLKGTLNNFYCISDVDEENLNQNNYFLDAIKVWGKPDRWKVLDVGAKGIVGPAMIWESQESLKVVIGVFEGFSPKYLSTSISYADNVKLSDISIVPKVDANNDKKLEQVRNTVLRLLKEDK